MLKPYYVLSPEYPSGGGAYEPPEWGRECVEVEAHTKREAVIQAVQKILREQSSSWADTNRGDGQSPFAGYTAELARCGHGYPHFVMVSGNAVPVRCWACDEAHERFEAEDLAHLNRGRAA